MSHLSNQMGGGGGRGRYIFENVHLKFDIFFQIDILVKFDIFLKFNIFVNCLHFCQLLKFW